MVSPNGGEGPQYAPMGRQGSLYNRTFDEVQSSLGDKDHKHLYRMNLDELLKNVISAESGQIAQNTASSSSPASHFLGNLNLNGTMSKKTMDEAWSDIVEQERVNRINNQVQQSSLGKTTVADFMVPAGAMNVGKQEHIVTDAQPLMAIDPMVVVSQQATDWMPLQMQIQMQIPGGINYSDLSVRKSASEICYSEKALPLGISLPITCSSEPQGEAGTMERKRRYSDEMLEKTIERRQKRMIKNRESAARSRAKKQEYTKNMEDKRDRLEQSNCWLKKIKEVEARFTKVTPKYQLRRTSSATF